ncbi:hypothetical protein [Haloarcula amylovorans]|uniref:hypothetical protein n=1 Tax=Haloarcula amylovorans TaxID=2562280 RepID=UPI001075FA15|nr:hypothetical protein [Halomicroarcula amylolytica]
MRRLFAVLALLGAVGLFALFAALGGGFGPFQQPPAVQVAENEPTEDVLYPFRHRDQSGAVSYVHVGERADGSPKPIAVTILNDGPERELPLSVRHSPTNETVYERMVSMPANATVVIVFHRPSDYVVTVTTARGTSDIPVRGDEFDCNDQTYGVAVEPDGQTGVTHIGTTIGCSG